MRKFSIWLAGILLIASTSFANAQTSVSGTVTSAEDGGTLPGVSVVIEGTSLGTTTDMDGKYVLSVPDGSTALVFSFVGMEKQTIAFTGQTVINVVLKISALYLNEVVVTALGISAEKKSLGFSVQNLDAEKISRAGNPNLATGLSGKIAGVEVRQSSGMPGAPATILIRGARSFSGNNQPLYVVDGMPISSNPDYDQNVTGAYYSGRSIDLDPNDIESLTILKGQAAAALYGIRASNGVILITTKSGKNTAKGDPTVNITSSFTADVVARLPESQSTYAQGFNGSFAAANSFSWGPLITDLPDDATYGGNSRGQSGLWFDPYKGEWVTPQAFDNSEGFFGTGGTFYNGVNISNSNEFGNYLVGFSATNQDGIAPNTSLDRYTAKASASMKLGTKWNSGFSFNYSDVDLQKLPSGNSSYLFTVMGAPPSYDLMGTPYHMEGALGDYRQISYRRGSVGENPRWAVENNKFLETTRRIFGNTYVEYTPTTWMNVRYQIGVDTYGTENEDIYQMGSAATGQALPTAGDYATPDNPVFGYRAPTGGAITIYGLNSTSINSLLNLTFNKNITEDLLATMVVGNEITDNNQRNWAMYGTGFSIPGWNNMANTSTQTATESKYRNRTIGTYYNIALDYKSMLFLNTSGRYDIVSTMPRDARSFFYPSVSLSFLFTEVEALGLKDSRAFPFGKIRASFAQVGQAGTYHQPTYVIGGAGSGFLSDGIEFPLGGISGYEASSTIYDPNLKPQNTSTYEVGVELKFIDNRIGVDYTYSSQTAVDQIFSVPMAGSTGYESYVTNAGEMTSKAHEVMLYITPIKSNDFTWDINANFTKIKNEVVSLAEGIESVSLAGYVTPNVRAYAGYTYPTIYGATMQRDENGNILIQDDPNAWDYGFPMSAPDGKIGDVSPDFIVGVTNTFRYKSLTLSAQLDWKKGGDIYSGTNRLAALYGTLAFTEDRTGTFTYADTENAKETGVLSDGSVNTIVRGGPGDETAMQDFYTSVYGSIAEMTVYETSYVKLREVSLTYLLPQQFANKIGMKKASISFVGRGFLLWSTLPNVDPETSQGMGNGQMGFEYVSLPQTTSYGVTVNLSF